jgi:hypothetical protein
MGDFGDGSDHPGYWPPFYDPTIPNTENGLPSVVYRPVTTILSNSEIGTVLMPIPQYYL